MYEQQHFMSDGMVGKWMRAFENDRHNVIIVDLLQKVDKKDRKNKRFTISSLPQKFCEVFCTRLLVND